MSTLGPACVDELPDDPLATAWADAAAELRRLVRALGVSAGCEDDVLQDVYLAGWQKRPRNVSAADLRRWLFRVTVNRCTLEHRRESRWRRLWQGWIGVANRQNTDDKDSVANNSARREEKQLVRVALNRIDPRSRSILVLRYFAELDSQEIGKILELPDSTVRSHLRTARQLLASELKRAGYEPD